MIEFLGPVLSLLALLLKLWDEGQRRKQARDAVELEARREEDRAVIEAAGTPDSPTVDAAADRLRRL